MAVCIRNKYSRLYTGSLQKQTFPKPTWRTNYFFNIFITFLCMFRALLCSSSGGQIVLVQHLVLSLSLGKCTVHKLTEDSINLCTKQSPKESDDTTCCTNTIWPPEDEHNSARNMRCNECIKKIKNLSIKLVKKTIFILGCTVNKILKKKSQNQFSKLRATSN